MLRHKAYSLTFLQKSNEDGYMEGYKKGYSEGFNQIAFIAGAACVGAAVGAAAIILNADNKILKLLMLKQIR